MARTAVVTGATAGFGRAIAQQLAQAGYRLILTGRRENRLKELCTSLRAYTEVLPLCFDVRNREQCTLALSNLPEPFHQPAVLVNNAGLAVGREPLQDGQWEDWDRMIETNVTGLLNVTRLLSDRIIAQRGHIVNIGSIAGTQVYPGGNVYCASKHAVHALSQAMRIDMLRHGVRVTEVRPGLAETEFSLVRFKGDEDTAAAVYRGLNALRPEDVANVVLYALSVPEHVCLNDIEITPTAQANSHEVIRS